MTQHLNFLFLGLASGAVYASLAMALVVTYRSSGVLNFATGATALVGAYVYAFLRAGELLVLVPGFSPTVDLGGPVSFRLAVLGAVVVSTVLGLASYYLVFRPLQHAPAVTKAVASIGLMVLLTSLVSQRAGASPIAVSPIFPGTSFGLGAARVPIDRFWFASIVVLLSLVLGAVFKFTRFGLHTRAAASSEKGAVVSGIPVGRIAALNWAISGATAGLAGVLIAPLVPLVPTAYAFFIVPALAAAILGGIQRLWPAVLGGLVIGMLQSDLLLLTNRHTWLPRAGLSEVLPLVLILGVLVARARPLPGRGTLLQQTLGRSPRPRRIAAPALLGAVVGGLALAALEGPYRAGLLTSIAFAVIALSMVIVTGYAGQISLAQLTLAGVGGFTLALLTAEWEVPFPMAPLLAAAAASLVGVLVGLPAVRIRGLPLAVVTLGLAVAVGAGWFQNSQFVTASGAAVEGPELLGIDLRSRTVGDFPRLSFCLLALGVLVLVAMSVAALRVSRLGSAMLAVRTNERAAAAAGINVVRTKVAALALAGFVAGIGGALVGYKQGNVTFDPFDAILGLMVFGTVYLCGITSVSGALLAGLLVPDGMLAITLDRWVDLGVWLPILSGVALIVNLQHRPDGLVGPVHDWLDRRRAYTLDVDLQMSDDRPPLQPIEVVPAGQRELALSISELTVHYGGLVAVDNVSFAVTGGTIVGLIGPNGAGKTTLVDAVSGLTESSGTIRLGGRDVHDLRPHERVRAGLGRTFQGLDLWYDLSVYENVVAGHAGALDLHRRDRATIVEHTLSLMGLSEARESAVGSLSRGHQQLVSIARALVGQPRLLVLDEPASGLDTAESAWLGQRLDNIRNAGVTILLIDHDMSLVLSVCDQVLVLDFGAIIATGTPATVRADPVVAAAYLGAMHTEELASS